MVPAYSHRIGRRLSAWSCVAGLLLAWPAMAAENRVQYRPEDEELVKALGEGYMAHRESFDSFTCRFVLTTGSADSMQDALAGNLSKPIRSEGLWFVRGENRRYELICDRNVMSEALKNPTPRLTQTPEGRPMHAVTLPCRTETLLSNGKFDMRYGETLGNANICAADAPLPGIQMTPWSINGHHGTRRSA